MRAIVQEAYGPPDEVLELREVDAPRATGDRVLVRVHAAAIAGDDWHIMRGQPYAARVATGLRRPKALGPGRDLAGVVEAVGPGVRRFAAGDRVFGFVEEEPGRPGALAELACVPEDALAPVPAGLGLEEAAAVPVSAMTALQAVRDKAEVAEGHRVLVVGASGGVGTFAVQIARAYGAHVTGVCSAANADLVRSLGADEVLDYRRTDPTRPGRPYDAVVDLVGDRTLSEWRRALTPNGVLVLVGGTGGRFFKGTHRWLAALAISPVVGQRFRPLVHRDDGDDLRLVGRLIEAGKVRPVVSARYPLEEVRGAIRHFEAGHATGKVVVTV